jgi:Helix-turn-helix domain
MAQAISWGLRRTIVAKREKGVTLQALAEEHGISYRSVQTMCSRYKTQGESGLKPRYEHCGKKRRDPHKDFVYRSVRCYKCWHPNWGAEKIRAELLLLRPDLEVPPARTLQKWFEYNGQNKGKSKPPRQEAQWGKRAHEVWQVDAKEEMQTLDGEKNCWLNIKDEHTGAVLEPAVFPL